MIKIRNLRNFNNIRMGARLNAPDKFVAYERGTPYTVDEIDQNDIYTPLTGYYPNYNGNAITTPVWRTRYIHNAYQDDLLEVQKVNNAYTYSPEGSENHYAGFIFNAPTVASTVIIKPAVDNDSNVVAYPNTFYVIASNDGVTYETISDIFVAPTSDTVLPSSPILFYDFNHNKNAYTEYRLVMEGNPISATWQYINAVHWY